MKGRFYAVWAGQLHDVTEDVAVVFDALANSMDAGSGFLDLSECQSLRRLAVLFEQDPDKVTPGNWGPTWGEKSEAERALVEAQEGIEAELREARLRLEKAKDLLNSARYIADVSLDLAQGENTRAQADYKVRSLLSRIPAFTRALENQDQA